MPTLHPRSGEQGQPVTIKHPSTPTPQSHWLDPHATAITVPDGELPATLNGVVLAPWHDHPTSADEWNALTNTTLAGQEPPLKKAPGMKLSAGVVVREPDGRFWVVAPTNRFGGYDWVFPKGTVGQGMSLQATALCEALEESGLRVRITGLLGDFARTTSVCRYYLAERIGGSPAAMGWESQAVALAPLETLPGLLTAAADQPVLAAIRQVLSEQNASAASTMLEHAAPPSFLESAASEYLGSPEVVTPIVAGFCQAVEQALKDEEYGKIKPEEFVAKVTALTRDTAAIFSGDHPDYKTIPGYHDGALRYKLMADLAPFWRVARSRWDDDPVCVLFEWLGVMMAEKLKETQGDEILFQVKFGPLMRYAVGVLLGVEARAR